MQEMEIYGVSFDMVGKQPSVLLKTVDGNKFLPIWIGHPDAAAICQIRPVAAIGPGSPASAARSGSACRENSPLDFDRLSVGGDFFSVGLMNL